MLHLTHHDEDSINDLKLKLANNHARKMGHMENYFAILQRQDYYKNFTIICKFNIKITEIYHVLFHSLRSIFLQNPILLSTIVTHQVDHNCIPRPHDYIKVIDELTMKDLFIELNDEIKQKTVGNELELYNALNSIKIPYGEGNTTWKLAILDDYTLAYLSNHVLSDGIAGKNFFQDLTTTMNEIVLKSNDSNIKLNVEPMNSIIFNYSNDFKKIGSLVENNEFLVDHSLRYTQLPEFIYNNLIISKMCHNSPQSPNDDINYHHINISSIQLFKIKESLQLHSLHQHRKITLTPYLQTAWLHAQYKTNLYPKTWTNLTNASLAVDTRQYMSLNDKTRAKYGLNTSAFGHFHYPIRNFNWNYVIWFNNYIKSCVVYKKSLLLCGLLMKENVSKKKNLDKTVVEQMKTRTRKNTLFSNIGLVESEAGDSNHNHEDHENPGNPGNPGSFKIMDVLFTQNFNGNFYDFSINSVATIENGLNIIITSPKKCIFSQEKFKECCEFFHKILIEGCEK